MEATDVKKQSEDARAQGNALYKSGKLAESIEWYLKAHNFDPQQSAPLANIAAAYFELGEYERSNAYADRALQLLPQDATAEKSRSRLTLRKARAHVLLKQYGAAQSVLSSSASQDQECLDLSQQLEGVRLRDESTGPSTPAHISPFKPALGESSQVEIVGDDKPASIFDSGLLSNNPKELSFLFTNVGDARHVFATLLHIADPALAKSADIQYHFDLADVNPHNIARLLVVLSMLEELAVGDQRLRTSKILAALFHTYMTPIMPNEFYNILQQHIGKVIDTLDGGSKTPSYLNFDSTHLQGVLEVLHFWQKDAQLKYPTRQVRATLDEELMNMLSMDLELFPAGLRKEAKLFRKTCVLRSSLEQEKNLSAQLDEDLKTNVTLLADSKSAFQGLTFDPFDFGSKIATREISGEAILADLINEWLVKVAKAIKTLQSSIHITLGVSAAPLPSLGCPNPDDKRDHVYDRIHLSQLPDLTGGTLFVYVFAVDHLRPTPNSYVTWKCQLYADIFTSWTQYDLEFLALINDKKGLLDVQKLFCVRTDTEIHAQDAGSTLFESTSISGYRRARLTPSSKLSHSERMPRAQLTAWLYRILLKIALPYVDEAVSDPKVLSPFSLSTFVCLITKLHDMGYPAHWLSEILTSILSGTIHTSARPPNSSPLKMKEVKASLAERDIDTSFVVDELSTLLHQWQDKLGFGVLSTDGMVRRFEISFEKSLERDAVLASFMLLLTKDTTLSSSADETLSLSKRRLAQLANAKMITILSWDAAKRTAHFCMSESAMTALKTAGYHIALVHVETWSLQSESRSIVDCTVEGPV